MVAFHIIPVLFNIFNTVFNNHNGLQPFIYVNVSFYYLYIFPVGFSSPRQKFLQASRFIRCLPDCLRYKEPPFELSEQKKENLFLSPEIYDIIKYL